MNYKEAELKQYLTDCITDKIKGKHIQVVAEDDREKDGTIIYHIKISNKDEG